MGRSLVLLALTLAAVMFVFPLTLSFPLLDPDEGLHASVAQEMIEQGDWLTPHSLGRPFLDKPIFYFWVQAAAIRLFGSTEMAVRLPGLMFGLLGAVATGLLGWRMFGRTTGLISGILYTTTILPTALAQAASHDVALIPWINLTLLSLWEFQRAVTWRKTSMSILGAGLFLGLAMLTKGLFGVAVVGVAYGSYLLITRRFSLSFVLGGAAVLLIAGSIASPWYILVQSRNPDYLRYFFWERHLLGFARGSQPHGDQPWWYYLPVLLGGGLPWIGYLPIVLREGLNRRQSAAEPLLWCWLIGWTLLMMVAGSKLATYLWPVFPAIAVLAATAWTGLIEGTLLREAARRSFSRTFVCSSWSGPIVLPAAVLALQVALRVRFAWPVWLVVGIAAAAAPLPWIPWRAGRWLASLGAATLSLAVQFVVVMTMVLPPIAEAFSARELAQHFNRLGRLPPRLLVAETRIGSLVFYLDPQLRAGLNADRIQQLAVDNLPRLQAGDVVAVPERKAAKLPAYFDLSHNPYESIGPYRLYQVELPLAE